MKNENIVVIGGGPAGMMSSITASRSGSRVTLVEKNHILGKKLLLTGNGRCNFTNTADIETFLAKFGKNGRFLRNAYAAFPSSRLVKFFEDRGLSCKVEEKGRMFPLKDKSAEVVDVLEKEMKIAGVTVLRDSSCVGLGIKNGRIDNIKLSGSKTLSCKAVILSTGGVSFPTTGSSGDGFKFSRQLGHSIIPPRPGLVPVTIKENYPGLLTGLSLSDISIKIFSGPRSVKTGQGDIIFTSHGLSGPLILSNSGLITGLLQNDKKVSIGLDMFPETSRENIDSLLSDLIRTGGSKNIKNCLKDLVQKRLLDLFLSLALPDPDKRSNQVTRKERSLLTSLCKDLRFTITGTHPIKDAMVTIGGICLKEVDPKTMASVMISGLYFAGEILDVAGDTGGFNLQAAFSTGYLAGMSAGEKYS